MTRTPRQLGLVNKRGMLESATVYTDRTDARRAANAFRTKAKSARIYERDVRAERLRIQVWIVVVRARG